jgi:hypothetical protein
MKLFSKITLICNLSFIIFILLGYIELNNKKNKVGANIMPLPFVTGTFVILGYLAVFINLVFCLIALAQLLSKKMTQVPLWLVIINFIFLLVQVCYFFI